MPLAREDKPWAQTAHASDVRRFLCGVLAQEEMDAFKGIACSRRVLDTYSA